METQILKNVTTAIPAGPARRVGAMPAGAAGHSFYRRVGKRLMDVVLASLLVALLLSWMVPILFILICTDSRGPLFFVQQRCGRGGRHFPCIKFRTMRLSTDRDLLQAAADDLRITRIGQFLRRTHIDELPQLLNVLLNHMSLVGPRPHMLYHDRLFSGMMLQYCQRALVKPGITGLAQAAGYHGPTPDHQSIAHRTLLDILYVRKLSAPLDAAIMFRTLFLLPLKRLRHGYADKR